MTLKELIAELQKHHGITQDPKIKIEGIHGKEYDFLAVDSSYEGTVTIIIDNKE